MNIAKRGLLALLIFFCEPLYSGTLYEGWPDTVDAVIDCNTDKNVLLINKVPGFLGFNRNQMSIHAESIGVQSLISAPNINGSVTHKSDEPEKVFVCNLKSGTYRVVFGVHYLNSDLLGVSSDRWLTVEIKMDHKILLEKMVLGICDTGRSSIHPCKENWGVRVFLTDARSLTITRVMNDWLGGKISN